MKKNTKKGLNISKGKILEAGAVAAIGAGAYYLFGPEKKSHQKKAMSIVKKVKKEVLKDTNKIAKITKPSLNKIVKVLSKNKKN